MTGKGDGRVLVVVGIDGSAESVAALRWAARYSNAIGAAVRVVMAWHYPGAVGGPPVGVVPETVRAQTEQQMQVALDEAVAKVYPDPAAAHVEVRLAYGHPAQLLIDESKNADLLVVGSHGHSAIPGMTLGSVSIHCVASASCPVTVVRGS